MIGEYEYEGIFEFFNEDFSDECVGDDCPSWNTINFYHKVSYVMFFIFMVVMTIIISNMLIGLAVDDIKGVQENAILRRQALKIQLALDSVYKLPNSWRYSLRT